MLSRRDSRFASFSLRLFPLVLVSLATACGESSDEEEIDETVFEEDGEPVTWTPGEDHADWEFKETTKYIKAPQSDSVEVTDSTLSMPLEGFEDVLEMEAGHVLIGNPHSEGAESNPHGFLRKVVSITEADGVINVKTEAANLADAFETCDMEGTFQLPDFGDLEFVAEDGTPMNPRSFGAPDVDPGDASSQIAFDIDGTVLFDESGLKATVTQGSFSFQPAFTFAIDAGITKGLKSFKAVATGTMDSKLVVELKTTQAITKSFQKSFASDPLVFPIGPINVLIKPKLEVGCTATIPNGASVSAGGRAQSEVALGVDYTKEGGLKPVAQKSFTLTRIGPTVNTPSPLTGRCFIRPSLDVSLSVVLANAGAKIVVEESTDLAVDFPNNACQFDLTLGVKGTADVNATALGFDVVDSQINLFNINAPLASNLSCAKVIRQ